MAFFNKKQEVMDIQLTQFGKELLSRGFFKPVYYQFFDDDILYDSTCAGVTESQNASEDRILKNTPRLKTQHLTFPVSSRYEAETTRILDGESLAFTPLRKTVPPNIQERMLLYPLYAKKPQDERAPSFNVDSLGQQFKKITFLNTTGSGIQQNIPIIEIDSLYTLKEDRTNLKDPQIIDQEFFINLFEKELQLADYSKLRLECEKVIIDAQENQTIKEEDSFIINVYEVDITTGEDVLIKIDDIEEINKYFHIKTNEHVEEVKNQDPESRNYYKRGEE